MSIRVQANRIGTYRTGDILEVLLAQISELNGDLAANLIVGGRRDADAARFRDALKPCRDVDTVAENVVGFNDYVANIDAHAEYNACLFHFIDSKFVNAGLELHCGPDRFDRARKLHQEPVAGVLHDTAAVFGNCRVDSVR